jgi:hypothetical protein
MPKIMTSLHLAKINTTALQRDHWGTQLMKCHGYKSINRLSKPYRCVFVSEQALIEDLSSPWIHHPTQEPKFCSICRYEWHQAIIIRVTRIQGNLQFHSFKRRSTHQRGETETSDLIVNFSYPKSLTKTQFWWFAIQFWRRICAAWHCLCFILLPWLEHWYCTESTSSGQTHDSKQRAAAWFICLHIIPLSGSFRCFRWQSSNAKIFPRHLLFLFSSITSELTSDCSLTTLI